MSKNQIFVMNVKGTRNSNSDTGVEKKLWKFRGSLTYAHSNQSSKNFILSFSHSSST